MVFFVKKRGSFVILSIMSFLIFEVFNN